MTQEIVNTARTMTKYEVITTIIAVTALAQPWIIKLINCIFRRIHVDFIPSAKIRLYYNRSGAYVYLGGVIESKNRAAVVRDIAVKVIRKKDKAELLLDWSSFEVPVFQSIGGNAVNTSEFARPFKVEAGSLYPMFIEFASTNIQENNHLNEIYSTMASEAAKIVQRNLTIDQAKGILADSASYKAFKDELLQNFYWKADSYVIELTIVYNDTKKLQRRFRFGLDENEAAEFKKNIEKSLLSALDVKYGIPTNMFYPQKDFVSDEVQ